ncbi:MAG TPA: hypothetical protein VHR66_28895 [Gemmataceae bacterium]|jgi:hypothetical protein|nr:hypothetical protein [Gemmataceae bacterium]
MAKTAGGTNIFVEKGEKIGLGVAAVVGVALLALGLMAAMDRPQDPVAFSKAVDDKGKSLTNQMNANDAKPIPPGEIDKVPETGRIATRPVDRNFFDPTSPPDSRRITPVVLAPNEGQADMTVLKILANDFQMEKDADGKVIKVRVGVVTAKNPDEKIDPTATNRFLEDMRKRYGTHVPKTRRPGAGMAGAAGQGGMPGPGANQGGMPGPGGFTGGAGGGLSIRGGPMAGNAGNYAQGEPMTAGNRQEVQYIEGADDEEIEKQLAGRRLAITIHPQKMVVLQAAFPYRAQLEKFKTALRYQTIEQLYQHPEDMPVFHGVDVQRRVYSAKGEMLDDWQTIDLAINSQELRAIKLYYNEDSNDLKRVELHEDHMLVMPLPHEIAGKYPDMKLKTIKDSIDKIKKADPKMTAPPPPKTKLGAGNPFKREEGPNAGLYNPEVTGGGAGGPSMLIPPSGKKGGGAEGGVGAGTTAAGGNYEPPDFIFVRVYDTDIQDGRTYEYRLRVRVKNPNFGRKTDSVSKASDADNEELPALDEHWYVFPQKVKLPRAGYYYVVDPTPPNAKLVNQMPTPREGQAVMQFQRWFDQLNVSEKLREPVGDWVQSELLATRGQYVYGKAFAPLPFWSSVDNAFILRNVADDKPAKGKEPRKGVVVEAVPPRMFLAVDIVGGKPTTAAAKIAPNPGEKTNRGGLISDEAATEVLLLGPEGFEVRSSARDKADPDRKEREDAFKKWTEETEKRNPSTPPPKGKTEF